MPFLPEVDHVFYYFRAYILIVAVLFFVLAVLRQQAIWFKRARGCQAMLMALSVFNIIFLVSQLGLGSLWDLFTLILAFVLFVNLVKKETGSGQRVFSYFISSFVTWTFWIFTLPYLIFIPSIFKAVK